VKRPPAAGGTRRRRAGIGPADVRWRPRGRARSR